MHQVHGVQGIYFARAWGATALIHAPYRTFFTQDDSATRQGLFVLGVPDLDAEYIGDGILQLHLQPPIYINQVRLGYRYGFIY